MTCFGILFGDIDTFIEGEFDCVGCFKTDCPNDKRVDKEQKECEKV